MENKKTGELCDRLTSAMNLRGFRPIDLSEQTGIPKSMVSYYMSGKSQPKADRLYKLAQTLQVNEAWLMGYDVPMERSPEQKRNDELERIIQRLQSDPVFFNIVSAMNDMGKTKDN